MCEAVADVEIEIEVEADGLFFDGLFFLKRLTMADALIFVEEKHGGHSEHMRL